MYRSRALPFTSLAAKAPIIAHGKVMETSYRTEGELPLIVHADGRPGVNGLHAWLTDQAPLIRKKLIEHGAILFRGFDVREAGDFERLARAINDDLKNEYMGLSPRNAMTPYVFTASEIPSPFPIPQHNEMSFVANPPRNLFFWCKEQPASGMGETPIVDMRKVYRDLDPEVRQRFERRGIRTIRNYSAPGKRKPWDFTQLKPWTDMFKTTDRKVVEEKCAQEQFTPGWSGDGDLKLLSEQPATKIHPDTGETVWFNHAAVFHTSNAVGETRRIFEMRPSVMSFLSMLGGRLWSALQRRQHAEQANALHCTYADGTEIPDSDMEAVRDALWKNLVVNPWKNGDVLAIDNDSTGHGRFPFRGKRMIAVSWA